MSKSIKGEKSSQAQQQAEAMAQQVLAQVDQLIDRRKTWENKEFKKANEALYGLLADCLSLFNSQFAGVTLEQRAALRQHLTRRMTELKIKVTKRTTTLNMLVRLVFGSDRQRAARYAAVVAEAVIRGKKPEELANWIAQEGGIEEIKRQAQLKPETLVKRQRLIQAADKINETLESDEREPLAIANIEVEGTGYVIMLGKPTADGTAILGMLKNPPESLRKSLIQHMAKDNLEHDSALHLAERESEKLGIGSSAVNDSQLRRAA